MARCLKSCSVHGLWLLSMILLASCVVHAHIINGRQSNTGSLTMTTTGEASMIIGDEKDAICYIKAALYCCKRTIQCYQDIAQCLRNCRKNV
ncbi:uncharacterized protein LOC100279126 precursor [Zea mays]|uniref:Uncharacterized protein n=1 Tax=Zea mays TaxID=4577 RepID=B6UI21_MAIZE|nr:uncharacterized protein LOC100279126 precursor [Zea mays]ACG49004.1 hypothetical protein [Zea mays]|eukprot:NP_001145639.1 uncharacterized protein LOC100279126 precursor [Zea mays]